jgi:plasmid stabilization system protein ParE
MEALLDAAAARLANFPESGRPGRIDGTREVVVHQNYTLVYELVEGSIYVMAVLHASQLWPPPSE